MNLSFHPGTTHLAPADASAILARRITRGAQVKGISGLGLTIQQESAQIGSMAASIAALAIPGVGPLVGGAIALATQFAVAIEGVFSGCGQACIQETQFVNQVEPILQQNIAAYTAYPVRTRSMQAAALLVFDQTWAKVVQFCGQASFGASGQGCISSRQEGACAWQSPLNTWQQQADGTYRWTPSGRTGCSNWFLGYRDPIANDPGVVDDPPIGATDNGPGPVPTTLGMHTDASGSTTVSIPGVGTFPLIAVVGVIALALVVAL